MTKEDLKNGMVVETMRGDRYIVIDDKLQGDGDFLPISAYRDDLTYNRFLLKEHKDKVFDIKCVYEPKDRYIIPTVLKSIAQEREPIWEREIIKKVTIEELEKMFGCKVEVVSKNTPEFKGCWGCDARPHCPDADSFNAPGCNKYVG